MKAELVYVFSRTHTSTLSGWRRLYHLSSALPWLLVSKGVRDSACSAKLQELCQNNDSFSTARTKEKDDGWHKASLLNAAGIEICQQPARYCGIKRGDER